MMEPSDLSPAAREGETAAAAPTPAEAARAEPEQHRSGVGLCLSGGGYRAALFHLGAVRRLNELGVLSKISTISSVSGGSILAAHLATTIKPWPEPGQSLGSKLWQDQVETPFRRFVKRNTRT